MKKTIKQLSLLALEISIALYILIGNPFRSTIDDSKISTYEKELIDDFYNKSPGLISIGENFDVKYVKYDKFSPWSSYVEVIAKGDRYQEIKMISLTFCEIIENNECKYITLEQEDINLFNRKNSKVARFGEIHFSDFLSTINDPLKIDGKANLQEVDIKIHLNSEVETFHLQADSQMMIDLYEPEQTLEIAVQEYGFDSTTKVFKSGVSDWIKYISNLYFYDTELYKSELERFIIVMKKYENGRKLIEEDVTVSSVFNPHHGYYEFDEEMAIFIHQKLLEMYTDDIHLNSAVESGLYIVLDNVNRVLNMYPEKELQEILEYGNENGVTFSKYLIY